MNASRFPQQIELAFWSFAIPLMRESQNVRYMVRQVYQLLQRIKRIPLPVQFVFLTVVGLTLGLVLGYTSAKW